MKKDLIDIFNHFGYETQIKKLHEECVELKTILEKMIQTDNPLEIYSLVDNFIDEVADNLLLILQFAYGAHLEDKISERLEFKKNRTKDRIKSGFYTKEEA